jgi:hypothetical protein
VASAPRPGRQAHRCHAMYTERCAGEAPLGFFRKSNEQLSVGASVGTRGPRFCSTHREQRGASA